MLGERDGVYTVLRATYRGIEPDGWMRLELDENEDGAPFCVAPPDTVFALHHEARAHLRSVLERSMAILQEEENAG